MGFKVGRVFVLDFSDTDADGAIVKVRSVSIGALLELDTAMNRAGQAEFLAGYITEWDLEDDDGPIPITAAGLLSLELPFFDLIYIEWLKATRGISAPFDRRSDGGGLSPEADPMEPSIPMESLSGSPEMP